jgi:hypothetical protein
VGSRTRYRQRKVLQGQGRVDGLQDFKPCINCVCYNLTQCRSFYQPECQLVATGHVLEPFKRLTELSQLPLARLKTVKAVVVPVEVAHRAPGPRTVHASPRKPPPPPPRRRSFRPKPRAGVRLSDRRRRTPPNLLRPTHTLTTATAHRLQGTHSSNFSASAGATTRARHTSSVAARLEHTSGRRGLAARQPRSPVAIFSQLIATRLACGSGSVGRNGHMRSMC